MKMTNQERFEKWLVPLTESGCWIYERSTKQRYPAFFMDGQRVLAHRAAWMIFIGPIPEEYNVLHKCDITSCCNPSHLYLGTQADNLRDAYNRRRRSQKGMQNGNAKLTEECVREIRNLARSGVSQKRIAGMYRIGKSQVSNIVRGYNW